MPSITSPTSIIANIEIINDLSLNKFDEIEISVDLFNKLFPNDKQLNDNYVVIKSVESDYFNSFKVFKIDSIYDTNNNIDSVKFVNNTSFFKFNNQITLDHCLIESVNVKDIPILDKVYILIPKTIYSILVDKTQDTIRDQLLNRFLKNNIISHGDLIRLINGEVKLCEPINQGIINHNTSIVLIRKEEKDREEESEPELEHDFESELDLSNYLSSDMSFYSDIPFKVKPIPKKILINNFPNSWSKEDNELFLFIHTSDLIKLNFPIFNGDAVKIITNFNQQLIVKLFTFVEPNNFKSGFVYLSPILLINLNIDETPTIRIQPIDKPDILLSSLIPIANQVTISRIASSITMDKLYQQHFFSNLKYLLNNQFKCVKVGDFIPVIIDSVLSKTMFDSNVEEETIPIGNPDSIAWFKIIDISNNESIETNQYIIDPLKTKLISSGIEFVKLPSNEVFSWYNYLNLPPVFNYNKYENSKHFPYVKQLKKILKTSLNSHLNTIILLNSLTRGIGKSTLLKNLSIEMGLNLIELDCNELVNPGQELKTIGLLVGKIDKILNNYPNSATASVNIIYLKHIENLCVETNINEQNANINTSISLRVIKILNDYLKKFSSNLIIVLSCNNYDKLNNNLKSIIKFKIDISIPNEFERSEVLKFLLDNQLNRNDEEFLFKVRNDVNFNSLATQSAGLSPLDLISIIKNCKKFAIKRLIKLSKQLNIPLKSLVKIGNGGSIILLPSDFNESINEARSQFSDSIGAPKIPNVKWEDIGGLDIVKDEILDTIDMPLKYPELFNNGLKKRSGILFYGPPGTGKTLLAKAIATNFSLNFFSVKGPELLNMYIGESEANVRKVFQRARDAKPCVIFFDELDSVAPKRGNQGDSGGVMDRIVSQLLAELDGMSSTDGEGVFVVGATNRPDLLDEALLRPGRFDKMLYLGISDTDEKQFKILEALTRKFKLDNNVNLIEIAKNCSFALTGADFYALCSDSMLNAMTRISQEIDKKFEKYNQDLICQGEETVSIRWWFDNVATDNDIKVIVKMEDFKKAQENLIPSVSVEELNHYLRIRENFEGGKDKALQLASEKENGVI